MDTAEEAIVFRRLAWDADTMSPLKIAMLGTRGVPARYGGFETAVEEIGRRLAARGHEVVVYCRGQPVQGDCYRGMRLVHLPALRHRVLETLSHTALSMTHVLKDPPQAAIVFNAANACLLPVLRLRRVPVAVHVDGLEWKRAKWGRMGKQFYRLAERLSVLWGDALIADAVGIKDYYAEAHGASAEFIPYGAPTLRLSSAKLLGTLALEERAYHLVVARLEPENHVDLIIKGYQLSNASLPLVIVGSVPYGSRHGRAIERLAEETPQVQLVGAVWDQQVLNELYAFARTYIHGHSVGGTNPSLLRAMGAGAPVVAFDVVFNREVAAATGEYFKDSASLARILYEAEQHPDYAAARGAEGRERVEHMYDWDQVAQAYEDLCRSLAARSRKA